MATIEERENLINEIVEAYPKKVGRERGKHMIVRNPSDPEQRIEADVFTIPGIMTNRG